MIKELLIKKKSSIVDRWIKSIYETYPPESFKFLNLQKDRFSNPVGFIISGNAERIFDEFINNNDYEKIKLSLKEIIKIRAVQDFSPAQATGFILTLKEAIYGELEHEIKNEKTYDEYIQIESGIDRIALVAFDLYVEAREKIFQIRVNEIKSKSL